jgi:putative ABC transport system substrate-binding protein
MKRRAFITLLGGAAAAWPLAARAQHSEKLPAIGFLGSTTPSAESQRTAAFVQRLRELGWIEGRSPRFPPWPATRPAHFPLRLCAMSLGICLLVVGTLPGSC